MTDTTKEIIKFYTEWSKLLVITLITLIAGIISLVRSNENGVTEYMLITIGIVTIFIIAIGLGYMTIKILIIFKNNRNGKGNI